MKRVVILSIILMYMFKSEAQTDINSFEYVVIPLQYEFLKGKDTYRLNTLTRVLFKREGFNAYFNEEKLPEDLFKDRCLALYADVKKVKGGFRKTKLEIILKDCNGEVIMKSDIGQSGENVHEKRHREALTDAFQSIERLNYSYKPKTNKEDDIAEIKKAISKKEENKVTINNKKETQDIEETESIEEVEDTKLVEVIEVEKEKIEDKATLNSKKANILIAQRISQGFEILDTDSKIVMTLYKTAAEDIYIVKDEEAIVFKNGIKWMYSKNDGISIALKELNIKF